MYEGAPGQTINRQKTTLFFSPNTNQGVKQAIQTMLGAQTLQKNCPVLAFFSRRFYKPS